MMSEPPAADPPPADPSPDQPAAAPAPRRPPGRRASPAAAFSSTDTARLLVRALAQLPPDERDQVYTWLLGSSLTPELGPSSQLTRRLVVAMQAEAPSARQQDFAEAGVEIVRNLVRGPAGSAQQMVPVRFSAEQHARLRAWCTEHGFSMATVIRGLVDRFLDSQQPEAT
jgi:ParG